MRPALEFVKSRAAGPVFGVEVGLAEAENALEIMKSMPIGTIFFVDNYSERPERKGDALKSLEAFGGWAFLETDSLTAASMMKDDHFDFVYIDADHSYEAVKADLEAWVRKVKPGGVLCGHDYLNDTCLGVREAVNEFVKARGFELHYEDLDWWVVI